MYRWMTARDVSFIQASGGVSAWNASSLAKVTH